MRRAVRLALALVLLAASGAARADVVALDLSACPAPPAGEVRALLALELRERLLPEAAALPAGARQVQVACDANVARLSQREPPQERAVSLESVKPELRARVLALSIAELLQQQPSVAAVAPVGPAPAPAPPSSPAPAPPRTETRQAQAPARFALWGGLEASATPLFALGGSLLFRARIARLFAWAGALSFTQGERAIDRGSLRVQSPALRTGPALAFERGPGGFLLGLGARVGLWLLRGQPDDPDATEGARFRSAYVGPALFAGGSVRLGKHALIALELELAYTMRRIKADVVGGGATTLGAWRSSGVLGAGAVW